MAHIMDFFLCVLSTSWALAHIGIIISYSRSHFADEGIEAQRGEVTFPRSHTMIQPELQAGFVHPQSSPLNQGTGLRRPEPSSQASSGPALYGVAGTTGAIQKVCR